MRLKKITLENFRGYREPTSVSFAEFTSIIGRNDVGKSTLLDALECFFNNKTPDADDAHIHGRGELTRIACEFDELPATIVIDADVETTLTDEHLLNEGGLLEIVKEFDLSAGKISPKFFARAHHPTAAHANDLLQLNNAKLKTRLKEVGLKPGDVDQRINSLMRRAIWAAAGDLKAAPTMISLNQDDGKELWSLLQKELPTFALFQADRPSRDDDSEVTDPMDIAIKEAIKAVDARLEEIRKEIKERVDDVAKRTLAKLREMDKTLADDLCAEFKSEPKWAGFKVTLNDHDGIPINKRGSGVRRLILLNFFRAEAERRQANLKAPGIIYAVEEPESSQHPDNQRMLVNALLDLAASGNTQVLITTHVPAIAGLVPPESVRFVYRDENRHPRVLEGTDDVLKQVADQLGVLPDKRVKVLLYVEGPNDVSFLEHISKLTGHIDLTNDPRVAFVVTGGGNLKHWVNSQYLRGLKLPEIHFYDRDNDHQYAQHVAAVNARGAPHWGTLTGKREAENYLHPEAVLAATQVVIAIDDDGDIPLLYAQTVHAQAPNARPWEEIDAEKVKKKCSTAKKRLCVEAASQMTLAMLQARDPARDIESLFERVVSVANA